MLKMRFLALGLVFALAGCGGTFNASVESLAGGGEAGEASWPVSGAGDAGASPAGAPAGGAGAGGETMATDDGGSVDSGSGGSASEAAAAGASVGGGGSGSAAGGAPSAGGQSGTAGSTSLGGAPSAGAGGASGGSAGTGGAACVPLVCDAATKCGVLDPCTKKWGCWCPGGDTYCSTKNNACVAFSSDCIPWAIDAPLTYSVSVYLSSAQAALLCRKAPSDTMFNDCVLQQSGQWWCLGTT